MTIIHLDFPDFFLGYLIVVLLIKSIVTIVWNSRQSCESLFFYDLCCMICMIDFLSEKTDKVEKLLKGSMVSIPSHSASVKIQIMGGKVCLRCKDRTLLGVVNKLLKTKSFLTSPSNVWPYCLN
jgi:hypothetical protein